MRPFMRTGLRLAVVLALASGAQARAGFMFQTIDVPGASETTAWGINGRGQVVGLYSDSSGAHGYLSSGGGVTPIGGPGGRGKAGVRVTGGGPGDGGDTGR